MASIQQFMSGSGGLLRMPQLSLQLREDHNGKSVEVQGPHDAAKPKNSKGDDIGTLPNPNKDSFMGRTRIKHNYDRWDKDRKMYDQREAGSSHLKHSNEKIKNTRKRYRQLADINGEATVGMLRGYYGVFGMKDIIRAVVKQGVPKWLAE